MSSTPESWNQLPTEILGIIFSNLQRTSDLLRSRLVCRSWNEECVRVMKKPESEFYQTLTESNIKHYIDFLHNGDSSTEVNTNSLPFHLDINLNIVNSEGTGSQCYRYKLSKLTRDVKSICANFGEECVSKLILRTPSAANLISEFDFTRFWLIELLVIISPGLKVLDLSDFNVRLGLYTDGEIKSTDLCDLKFPKLKTLTCSKSKLLPAELQLFANNAIGLTLYSLYPYIVDRSPNMANLEQINTQELISLAVNYDKLKSLLIDGVIEEPSNILEKICQSDSPKFQKLAFSLENYSIPDGRTVIFQHILELVSSTLKSLCVTTMDSGNQTAPLMTFPLLPNLQHLRININMSTTTPDLIYFDTDKINFKPDNLPNLKSVDLSLWFILTSHSCRKFFLLEAEEFDVPVKFSTVIALTIRIQHNIWCVLTSNLGEQKIGGALKHLMKIFPNVSKLSIVNESIEVQDQPCVKSFLQSLVRSPLTENIHEICIEGFDEDFLGQVLKQIEDICDDTEVEGAINSLFFKGIRKIKLGLSKVSQSQITYRFPQRVSLPNLTAMAKYFPSLQIIEVSQLLFPEITDEERRQLIQTLTTAYPYLWIHCY